MDEKGRVRTAADGDRHPFQILLVDDHPVARAGLTIFVSAESDLEICAEAEGIEDAILLAQEKSPDLVLVDLKLKAGSGLELCRRLATMLPELRMLVLSACEESFYAERSLHAGARGFVNKAAGGTAILEAIRTVVRGNVWLSPQIQEKTLRRISIGEDPAQSPIEGFSDPELEIFELIGRGRTTQQIAARLQVSPKSVEAYREKLKRKLHVGNSIEMTRHAVQWVLDQKRASEGGAPPARIA